MKKRLWVAIIILVCLVVGISITIPVLAKIQPVTVEFEQPLYEPATVCSKCGADITGEGTQSELAKALGLGICMDCWMDILYGSYRADPMLGIARLGEDGKVLPEQLPPGSGAPTWGEIIGTLSNQVDLYNKFNEYEPADPDIQTHINSAHAPSDAQKNADILKSEIEAVLTGEITSHTHTGGGSVNIKAGTITTNGSGEGTVTFNTPFEDTNYAISLTAITTVDTVICMANTKTVNGFDVVAEDDGGKSEANVIINWIATPYSNP